MSTNRLTIQTGDGILITLDASILDGSKKLTNLINALGVHPVGDTHIPLPTIDAKIFNAVVKWYEYQAEYHSYCGKKDAIEKWKTDFIYGKDAEILFDVIHAAEDLEIPNLLDCIFRMAADMISSCFLEDLGGLLDEVKVGTAQYLLPYAYLAASGAGVVPTTRDLKHRAKIWTSVCKSDTLFKPLLDSAQILLL
jgi:hypothetical protein